MLGQKVARWEAVVFIRNRRNEFRARIPFNSFDFIFVFLPVTLAALAAAVRLRSSSVAVLLLDGIQLRRRLGHCGGRAALGGNARPFAHGHRHLWRPSPAGVFQIRRLPDDDLDQLTGAISWSTLLG
jgi:hypothetical protein